MTNAFWKIVRRMLLAALVGTALTVFAMQALAVKFDVPQGDERLLTIALVECLAEENSRSMGEYCYTTYSCSPTRDGDGMRMPGTLWRGLPYHDGRRVTTADDDIAFGRSCVMTVADDAKITWFTGYRPDGKEGEVVGIVKATGATPAVPHDNMLEQFLSHKRVGGRFRDRYWYDRRGKPREMKTLDDWLEYSCGATVNDICISQNEESGIYLEGIPATLQTGCYVEQVISDELGFSRGGYWLSDVAKEWTDKAWPYTCPDAEN